MLGEEGVVQTFQLYVHDDRYVVPTLVFVEVATIERARTRAEELLSNSPHHLSVEVCQGGRSLLLVDVDQRHAQAPMSDQRSAS